MPRKPDRFERAVGRIIRSDANVAYNIVCFPSDAVNELRKEHRWVERMVRKVDAWACQELADNDDIIAAILEQLKQRRR